MTLREEKNKADISCHAIQFSKWEKTAQGGLSSASETTTISHLSSCEKDPEKKEPGEVDLHPHERAGKVLTDVPSLQGTSLYFYFSSAKHLSQ